MVCQILALNPRYIPGISGPKGAGQTNDWCITESHKGSNIQQRINNNRTTLLLDSVLRGI